MISNNYYWDHTFSEFKKGTKVHNEVHELLSKILGQECVIRDAYSPYFYKIGKTQSMLS